MYAQSCVLRRLACHHTLHANHWHCLWIILATIGVKINITIINCVCRLTVNLFYCGRILFSDFKRTNIKGVSAWLKQRPLTMGIARRQFLSLRGTTWRNNGSSMRTSLLTPYSYFKWRILTFTRWNWKCHVIIISQCTQPCLLSPERPLNLITHSLVPTAHQILQLLHFPFAHTLVYCENKTPPKLVLIP